MTFVAGSILRASDLNTFFTTIQSFQTLGNTLSNSHQMLASTTLTTESPLTFSNLTSGATYKVFGQIFYQSSTTADIKVGFACTGSGATLTWYPVGYAAGATVTATADDHTSISLSGNHAYGGLGAASTAETAAPSGILYAGTGVGISFSTQWAQNTSDGVNGTTLVAGTNVVLMRIL